MLVDGSGQICIASFAAASRRLRLNLEIRDKLLCLWLLFGTVCSPATGGEDDDGAGAAFEGRLHGADGGDLRGVGGEGGEPAQLFKQLLVEDGSLGLSADL